MARFDHEVMTRLWNDRSFPCISIYLPIIREGNDISQTPIRLNTLINQASEYLKENGLTQLQIQSILDPAVDLLEQPLFWAFAHDGLAIFCSEDTSITLSLHGNVIEQLKITDHFVTRPLIEQSEEQTDFLLLAIGRGPARLYSGRPERIVQIISADMPESFESVLAGYSYEKQRRQQGGFDNRKDRDRILVENFCRQVDNSILELEGCEKLPLVVACVDYLFAEFRKISKNQNLVKANIPGSPDHLSEIELHKKALAVLTENLPDPTETAWQNAQNYLGSELVRNRIGQILDASAQGKVDKLFIPRSVFLYGSYDEESKQTDSIGFEQPENIFEHNDLMEVAAVLTLQNGGKVYSVEADKLPEEADAMAILRY